MNKHKFRDSWFLDEYSVNPYQGCSSNCLYCYTRGSKYGENMEEKMAYKENLPELLEKQLKNAVAKGKYGFIAIGTATDAYMPVEEKYQLTRTCLELFLKYRFPVFISTKSDLILRDFDLLKKIDAAAILPSDLKPVLTHGVILSVSLSTLNEEISDMLEPGAIRPVERLTILEKCIEEGFLAGVNAIPLLPFISDTYDELEKIISKAKESGAEYLLAGSLSLFGKDKADSRTLYYNFLERTHPHLMPQYDQLFAGNQFPPKSYQQALSKRTAQLCAKYQIRNRILS
ncbi:MAG: radical SAM protein [Chitinophagales bacterium]